MKNVKNLINAAFALASVVLLGCTSTPQKSDERRLPSQGAIQYRINLGDTNTEIGKSRHAWIFSGSSYRLSAVSETAGTVGLLKPWRIEIESTGLIAAEGLKPQVLVVRRSNQETDKKVTFDWNNMKVTTGGGEFTLDPGAQDLLSFNYQFGFLPHPEFGRVFQIATSRNYSPYQIEVLGDEYVEVPIGLLRTVHLRVHQPNEQELWLAYDYWMLPVKIRHSDNKGKFVQVATYVDVGPKE